MEKIVLFGAGVYARRAIDLIGHDKIELIFDNNSSKWGSSIDGIPVKQPDLSMDFSQRYRLIITVSSKYQGEVKEQLSAAGITKFSALQDIQTEMTREKLLKRTDYIEIYQKAIRWIYEHSIDEKCIACNSEKRLGYPEVTGYYIPTLLRFGHRDLAFRYARWLCSIQKPTGAWYDTDDRAPYVFDTAQILKGLLAVSEFLPEVDSHIIAGCEWLLGNMREDGRLLTPVKDAWGPSGVCSELIHLYCLSPLVQAAEVFGRFEYKDAAYKILDYYKKHNYEEIMNFGFLSHFYAYVIEGLLDMGEEAMAREAMNRVALLQKENGAVPAYANVDWVCSTGLFQFALIWFRLGEMKRGNQAFTYACKLQNESGGWYGSYLSEENPGEDNDYFPTGEISWAVKYFLDALYYKNLAEFNRCADSFLSRIDKKDGRYLKIKGEIARMSECKPGGGRRCLKVCDVGSGKGRYLDHLSAEEPQNLYYAVDVSDLVLKYITNDRIEKRRGSLTKIPYPDRTFDVTFTCEALEHAIDIESAVREMVRVTKPGGKVIVVDKNKEALGRLDITDWEVWFDIKELSELMRTYCSDVAVEKNIPYEDKINDCLFAAWIGKV